MFFAILEVGRAKCFALSGLFELQLMLSITSIQEETRIVLPLGAFVIEGIAFGHLKRTRIRLLIVSSILTSPLIGRGRI